MLVLEMINNELASSEKITKNKKHRIFITGLIFIYITLLYGLVTKYFFNNEQLELILFQ